jgi:hypothetical protein
VPPAERLQGQGEADGGEMMPGERNLLGASACLALAALLLVIVVALAGCASPAPATVYAQPIRIAPDNLCSTKRPTWSVWDTSNTIAEQVAGGELWDKRCAKGAKR